MEWQVSFAGMGLVFWAEGLQANSGPCMVALLLQGM
tara:strand:+ start:2317 stop:2424 length:108 start_codon:yes stop_codon:yes gene_type:complete